MSENDRIFVLKAKTLYPKEWFCETREGLMGPFSSERRARLALLRHLKKCMQHHVDGGRGLGPDRGRVVLSKADPTFDITKLDIGGKEIERDRVLTESEIRELSLKLESANMQKPIEYALWIILSTCCRVGEISKARWEHVDFELRTWTIPDENSKNAKALTIYLSDFALRQFEGLLALKASEGWIFPARSGLTHVFVNSITKQVGDRQRTKALKNQTKLTGSLVLSGGKWTPHDLRRTGATLMGRVLGVPSDVVERCLNQTEKNKVKRIYQRQELTVEQAGAWRLLGERLELLTRTDADNVVSLPRRVA